MQMRKTTSWIPEHNLPLSTRGTSDGIDKFSRAVDGIEMEKCSSSIAIDASRPGGYFFLPFPVFNWGREVDDVLLPPAAMSTARLPSPDEDATAKAPPPATSMTWPRLPLFLPSTASALDGPLFSLTEASFSRLTDSYTLERCIANLRHIAFLGVPFVFSLDFMVPYICQAPVQFGAYH